MTQRAELASLAHSLRDGVHFADTDPVGSVEPTLDYLHQPTAGRITYGEAVRRFGASVVHAAMAAGELYLSGVPNIPTGAAFDPANARPEMRLQANGQTAA